jgi:predicted transcriptional regulator
MESPMKAIIELNSKKSIFGAVKQQIAEAQKEGKSIDYHLGFESARALFSDLTPARIDLLDTLRRMGPSSMYALAKTANRNYSNIHTDVSRLLELGLIDRSEDGLVSVPFDAIEIRFPLAQVA